MEKWVPISGYEGFYEVSDMGRVRSIERLVKHSKGKGTRKMRMRLLKPMKNSRGYLSCTLSMDGKVHTFRVHYLILNSFNPKSNKNLVVNHINLNQLDNRLVNLEWVTQKENLAHARGNGHFNHNLKSVVCIDTGECFESISSAAKHIGSNLSSLSVSIKKGFRNRGLKFAYKEN